MLSSNLAVLMQSTPLASHMLVVRVMFVVRHMLVVGHLTSGPPSISSEILFAAVFASNTQVMLGHPRHSQVSLCVSPLLQPPYAWSRYACHSNPICMVKRHACSSNPIIKSAPALPVRQLQCRENVLFTQDVKDICADKCIIAAAGQLC